MSGQPRATGATKSTSQPQARRRRKKPTAPRVGEIGVGHLGAPGKREVNARRREYHAHVSFDEAVLFAGDRWKKRRHQARVRRSRQTFSPEHEDKLLRLAPTCASTVNPSWSRAAGASHQGHWRTSHWLWLAILGQRKRYCSRSIGAAGALQRRQVIHGHRRTSRWCSLNCG